jgi:hypothetical protein
MPEKIKHDFKLSFYPIFFPASGPGVHSNISVMASTSSPFAGYWGPFALI